MIPTTWLDSFTKAIGDACLKVRMRLSVLDSSNAQSKEITEVCCFSLSYPVPLPLYLFYAEHIFVSASFRVAAWRLRFKASKAGKKESSEMPLLLFSFIYLSLILAVYSPSLTLTTITIICSGFTSLLDLWHTDLKHPEKDPVVITGGADD